MISVILFIAVIAAIISYSLWYMVICIRKKENLAAIGIAFLSALSMGATLLTSFM